MLQPLPIDPSVGPITDLVRRTRRAVIVAPPGSGKTTRIPPALATLGRTILLQPRRVAARALARRIASERAWTIGEEIGWQIRFERRFSDRTQLLVATEGILTARLQSDPLLSDFSVVILDEFHERSIHADLALALVKQAAESREDLAVVVMSATIDAAPVARFIGAEVVNVDTPRHRVDVLHRPNAVLGDVIVEASKSARGDVLVFLPGAREIERATSDIGARLPGTAVLPLHGSLEVDAQERALMPLAQRKVILSTNVAETSLTVEGVTDVVDSGLHRTVRFDPDTAVDHLETELISRDSADQRAGRAGRTGPGRAFRLWDERAILRSHREPEIARVDLASTALDIFAWGGDPREFEWFERPPQERLDAAVGLLEQLGAIEGRRLRAIGEQMRELPLHPRLARVLIAAHGSDDAVHVCAFLSEDTRRVRRQEHPPTTPCDALSLAESMRNSPVARELRQIAQRVLGGSYRREVAEEVLLRAIFSGYPDRVAQRRAADPSKLLLASGTGAVLARESGVREGEFLVALDVAGGAASGDALVRTASYVSRDWMTPTSTSVEHRFVSGKVRATKKLHYGAILLREINVQPDAEEAARLIAQELVRNVGDELARRIAFAGLTVDWNELAASYAGAGNAAVDLESCLPWDVRRELDRLAPVSLALPSGRSTRLEYREDGSVHASAKLQELFGLAETPLIGPHRKPVILSLLAPNGRPVQVTQDLRSFWDNTYPEVRKELRGRYPKHPWPDDPWTATPTHRAKPRR